MKQLLLRATDVDPATFAIALVVCSILGRDSLPDDEFQERAKMARFNRVPDVMYIPTPHDIVKEMLDLADVGKDDVVYDLGCGDGRIVVAAAQRYGCRAVGVDIDPLRVKEARQKVRDNHLADLVKIELADIFDIELDDATVVTLYLSTKYNTNLLPQLRQTRPGCRIVSHLFGIKGIEPDQVVEVTSKKDNRKHRVLLWRTPLKRR